MRHLFLTSFIILIYSHQVFAIEHNINPNNMNVKIVNILRNDEVLTSTLKSGLSSQVLKIIKFKKDKDSQVIIHSKVSVKFDLWDEKYLSKTDDNSIVKFNNLDQIIKELSKIDQKFSEEFKKNLSTYDLQVIFFINPISKTKSKLIKEWMAQRFVGPSSLEIGRGTNAFVAGVVNKVISQQLDKSIYGADREIIINVKSEGGKNE